MERCKTCKHWDKAPSPPDTFGKPARGYCKLSESSNGYADVPNSLAVAQDGESYRAYLVTAESFGCVQWQERDA